MNILLGLTGSVATKVAHKIIEALESVPNCDEVRVVMTEKACMFWNPEALSRKCGVKVYTERDEWTWVKTIPSKIENREGEDYIEPGQFITTDKWEKGLPILHVELAKWASCLVIAPATANTIAKVSRGICDNLLTCIYAAWDESRPVVIAPSMNTRMWTSRNNAMSIHLLGDGVEGNVKFVSPVEKELACGDVGIGALADAKDIAKAVHGATRWSFPMFWDRCTGVPIGSHPGSFGAIRKHDCHCGVDLYCTEGTPVLAVEPGVVVSIEDFTGHAAGCGWWLDTKAVKVEGASGVVCYGEINPCHSLQVGDKIDRHNTIGYVKPVLRPGKERPDIPGHSRSMLHLQLYKHGTIHGHACGDKEVPDNVIDPTPLLLDAVEFKHLSKLEMP